MFDSDMLKDNCVIRIPSGVHYIREPVRISGKNIRIIGDGSVLRGAVRLCRDDFTDEGDGVYSASVSSCADGFYIGSRRYRMARYPKETDPDEVFGGYAADCIFPQKTKEWKDPAGGYIHAMHKALWGGYTYRIVGKKDDGELELEGGWQNNRQMGMHDEYRFAENIREEMTCEGEWYFDEKEMRIYVRLCAGDDLDKAEAVVSKGFFIFDECSDVTIENVIFERSARTFMETKEPLLRSDWTIYRGGAVLFRNSTDCRIDRCVFRDIGSNGVFTDGKCRNVHITRTHFHNIGASAACFVGYPDSVRSPLFEYGETRSVDEIDKTPGPASDNYPADCSVEDCLLEYVGMTEKQATGVEISMSYGITVKNCTICRTSRAGINISEGTFGGHRIEGCDVFDTVRETGDHGSFNSWGRDRFWHLRGSEDGEKGRYASLDMLAPNVITRSRFRCDRGWDIDLDDGSSNYIITENLCLNGGIKLREGFFRTVRNNIAVNNTLHAHVWYPKSGDIVENNIFFREYAPVAMPEKWGQRVDGNIMHMPGQSDPIPADILVSQSGQDSNSVCLDAGFADAGRCDYRPTHPALMGFENFPTEFGVRYKPLRDIAPEPVLPVIVLSVKAETVGEKTVICGMTVKNIESDGEMSAYGTAEHNGVIVFGVDKGSEAEKRGLLAGDVIIGCGKAAIDGIRDMKDAFSLDEEIVILRSQTKMTL